MKRRPSPTLDTPGRALLLGLFLIASFSLLPLVRWDIDPDGVSYMNVAHAYLRGDFGAAVNGYWAPMYSWLLAGVFANGIEPILAAHLLGVVFGVAALHQVWALASALSIEAWTRRLVVAACVPLTALASVAGLSPDLLLVCLLLWYVRATVQSEQHGPVVAGVLTGLAGALSYFTKAYAFYFVLAHLLTVGAADLLLARSSPLRKSTAVRVSAALATFLVLSSTWMAVLYSKYGTVTVSTSSGYNRALLTSPTRGHPMFYAGFFRPPSPSDTSAWSDPSYFDVAAMRTAAAGLPAASGTERLIGNVRTAAALLVEFAPSLLLLGVIALSARSWRRLGDLSRSDWIVVAAAAIYLGGYVPLTVALRYIYVVPMLLALAGGALVQRAIVPVRPSVGIALCLAMWPGPVGQLWNLDGNGSRPSVEIAGNLGGTLPAGCRLASNGAWKESLYVAYRAGCQYFGQRGDLDASQAKRALADLGVEFYLEWTLPGSAAPLFEGQLLGSDPGSGVRVFAVPLAGEAPADSHAN